MMLVNPNRWRPRNKLIIPNAGIATGWSADLPQDDRSRVVISVILASWVRSFSRNCGIRMTTRRAIVSKKVIGAALLSIACCAVVWLTLPKPPLLDGISFSQCIRDRNGKLLRVTLTPDQKFRIQTPLGEISPELIDATLRYEDKYYSRHPGVNPIALGRSALEFMRWRRVTTGGSTITMQVARLRFHLRTRSLAGKFTQIVRALELERHYSKEDILEAYLNLAPYGRNIEGIGAASQIYFDKSPAHLTAPEAVSLSVIPQSPSRRALLPDRENASVNLAQNNWYDRAGAQASGLWGEQASGLRSALNSEFSPRGFRARIQTV